MWVWPRRRSGSALQSAKFKGQSPEVSPKCRGAYQLTPRVAADAVASAALATAAYRTAHGFRFARLRLGAIAKSRQRKTTTAPAAVITATTVRPRPAALDTNSRKPADASTNTAGRIDA